MVRSLNGLSTGSVRSLNGLNVDTITADLPVLITNRNITIEGLNGFGTAGQIIKVNSGANGLEYANETDTQYTATSPLLLQGTAFSLSQTAFNITTSLTDGDYVPFFDSSGNFDRITALNLKSYFTDTLYYAQAPLLLFGSRPNTPPTFGLSTLSGYGLSGEIITSTGTALAYSNSCSLSVITTTSLEQNKFYEYTTASNLIEIGNVADTIKFFNGNAYTISMPVVSSNSTLISNTSFNTITTLQDTDFILVLDGNGTTLEKITKPNLKTQLGLIDTANSIDFGTTATANIDIGNTTYQTRIAGNAIYLNNASNGEIIFQGANDFVNLYLLEDSGSLVRNNGLNIAGYFQATAKVVLGNSTNNTEVFGNDVAITGGLATGSASGGFTRRVNIFNRGLYLYQSPWGGSGSSTVGRASWLITPGFQQFRLEFHLTSTDGSLIWLSYINGVGVYVVEYSFTGQHKSKSINDTIYDNIEDYVGLICYATGEYATYDFDNETCNSDSEGITINDSMPIIDLCNTKKDKRVYGVISNKEDTDREMGYGRFVSKLPSANDANRVVVNGIGEGAIWIVNTNGNFENGDYIQTSNIAGYGEKQDDDLLHNYTVAKITCDCDFNMLSNKYRSKMVGDNIACFVGVIYYCG
tara:strand:+ start:26 stop:1945 length:1920 start_codon:yes stop_codon:yes gene_type:complete